MSNSPLDISLIVRNAFLFEQDETINSASMNLIANHALKNHKVAREEAEIILTTLESVWRATLDSSDEHHMLRRRLSHQVIKFRSELNAKKTVIEHMFDSNIEFFNKKAFLALCSFFIKKKYQKKLNELKKKTDELLVLLNKPKKFNLTESLKGDDSSSGLDDSTTNLLIAKARENLKLYTGKLSDVIIMILNHPTKGLTEKQMILKIKGVIYMGNRQFGSLLDGFLTKEEFIDGIKYLSKGGRFERLALKVMDEANILLSKNPKNLEESKSIFGNVGGIFDSSGSMGYESIIVKREKELNKYNVVNHMDLLRYFIKREYDEQLNAIDQSSSKLSLLKENDESIYKDKKKMLNSTEDLLYNKAMKIHAEDLRRIGMMDIRISQYVDVVKNKLISKRMGELMIRIRELEKQFINRSQALIFCHQVIYSSTPGQHVPYAFKNPEMVKSYTHEKHIGLLQYYIKREYADQITKLEKEYNYLMGKRRLNENTESSYNGKRILDPSTEKLLYDKANTNFITELHIIGVMNLRTKTRVKLLTVGHAMAQKMNGFLIKLKDFEEHLRNKWDNIQAYHNVIYKQISSFEDFADNKDRLKAYSYENHAALFSYFVKKEYGAQLDKLKEEYVYLINYRDDLNESKEMPKLLNINTQNLLYNIAIKKQDVIVSEHEKITNELFRFKQMIWHLKMIKKNDDYDEMFIELEVILRKLNRVGSKISHARFKLKIFNMFFYEKDPFTIRSFIKDPLIINYNIKDHASLLSYFIKGECAKELDGLKIDAYAIMDKYKHLLNSERLNENENSGDEYKARTGVEKRIKAPTEALLYNRAVEICNKDLNRLNKASTILAIRKGLNVGGQEEGEKQIEEIKRLGKIYSELNDCIEYIKKIHDVVYVKLNVVQNTNNWETPMKARAFYLSEYKYNDYVAALNYFIKRQYGSELDEILNKLEI